MDGHSTSVERTIPAPAEQIFELLADPTRHHEFDGSGTVTGPATGASRVTVVGDRFTTPMRQGLPYKMVNTVVEFEEGRRIAWQPRSTVPVIGALLGGPVWRYELEPAEGGTLVRETWDLAPDPLRELLKRSPLARRTEENMRRTLEQLAQAVR